MKLTFAALVAIGGLAWVAQASPAAAEGKRRAPQAAAVDTGGAHPKSAYYRRGPRVKGFVQRRGGYSFSYADIVNTYGSSRTVYGGSWYSGDLWNERQTHGGPFDHGFFFDSGAGPRGGEIPYIR